MPADQYDPASTWTLCLVVVGLVTLAVVVDRVVRFREGLADKNRPHALFRELCKAHGLNRADATLLKEISKNSVAEFPAEVFLRQELFESGGDTPEVSQLCDRLFSREGTAPGAG